MRILAIETSCDETSLAIIETSGEGLAATFSVRAHLTASQIELHAKYGGVFPAMAKREHAKTLVPLFEQTLKEAQLSELQTTTASYDDVFLRELLSREQEMFASLKTFISSHKPVDFDLITVTSGPGLEPTLWVGINFARALGYVWNIPVFPVNHMEGHILSVAVGEHNTFTLPDVIFPALSLLVSGGHTELVMVKAWGEYEKIGETLDDAVGEAFDKVARLLGLSYPGGPELSRLAKYARENCIEKIFELPRPMLHSKDLHFSFSGIKTSVMYKLRDKNLTDNERSAVAREFEDAVVEVLVSKTLRAFKEFNAQTLIVGGGVSANQELRQSLKKRFESEQPHAKILFPEKTVTGDNALMIGIAGYVEYTQKKETLGHFRAQGNLEFKNFK